MNLIDYWYFAKADSLALAYPHLILFAGGVPDELIIRAEGELGTKLPDSYRFFLKHYGSASIRGEVVFGLLPDSFSGIAGPDVVSNTFWARSHGECELSELLLIDNEGEELFILSERDESVIRRLHESVKHETTYALSFSEFLYKRCVFCVEGERSLEHHTHAN
jgi:antitoxin YobK